MRCLLLIFTVLVFRSVHGQAVDWMVDDAVNYTLNPAMPEHRIAAAPGALVSMRVVDIEFLYGSRAYGTVAMVSRDPGTGELLLSCLLGDSVSVAATVVEEGVAYFAGRFSGDALILCDGTTLSSIGSGFTENHFILAWELTTGEILWSRNISQDHPDCQDLTSLAVDEQGRLWYYMRDFGDAQVVRVDASGNDQVSRVVSGIRHLGTISFDPWGGLYASGSCDNGTLSFGGQDYLVESGEGYNMFVLRFRSDGTAGFAQFAEDITFQDPTVVVTQDGHAYLAGSIFIETTWGGHTVNGPNWGSGVFIARLDSTGAFQWNIGSQQEPGVIMGDIASADGPCITVDPNGRVCFLGVSRGLVDWGNGISSGALGLTDRCMTILNVDPAGTPQWALTSEPTTWGIEPQGITAGTGDGSIHFAVHVADPFQMDGIEAGAVGAQSAVVGRVATIGTDVLGIEEMPLRIWPVPTSRTLNVLVDDPSMSASLCSTTGQVVRSFTLPTGLNTLDVSALPRGVYLLRTSDRRSVGVVVE